jgi:hypothetical protein
MTIALLIILALVALAAAAARGGSPAARPRRPAPLDIDESPSELALRDPVEALLRYGTPADAARLAEQGQDLSALGYRKD